jgi:hypothetical protein
VERTLRHITFREFPRHTTRCNHELANLEVHM